MAIDTYSELLNAVANYADTDRNPSWEAALPGFPALVEAKIRKRLRIGAQERTAEVSTVDDRCYYALPPRCQELRLIEYQTPQDENGIIGKRNVLRYVEPSTLSMMRRGWEGGSVENYTLMDGQVEVVGTPAAGGLLRIVFVEGLEPLSDAAPSNWLLLDYPDVYLSGCMVESYKFQKPEHNDSAPTMWANEFETEIASLIASDKRDRWSGPPRTVQFERW